MNVKKFTFKKEDNLDEKIEEWFGECSICNNHAETMFLDSDLKLCKIHTIEYDKKKEAQLNGTN